MHPIIKHLLAAALTCLAAAFLPSARGQLVLTGSSSGDFIDPGLVYTSVLNGPTVSTFESGVAYRPLKPYFDTKTSIVFTGASFAGIGNGDILDLGGVKITNGVTRLGTTASWAAMDLYLNLPLYGADPFKLTTLLFSIDNTANQGAANIPDLFYVGHTAVNTLALGGRQVNFDLKFTNPALSTGSGASISEGKSALDGIYATVLFTPVPEASTYALAGSLLLVGAAGLRRFRTARAAV